MWSKKNKITELPFGIEYLRDTKELNLTSTAIDMIPKGLKGVNAVRMSKEPEYIAPDFFGDVYVSRGSGTYEKLPPINVCKAKFGYRQDPDFVESFRYVGDSALEVAVLPTNMHFYEKDEKVYLDLSKTAISEPQKVLGVDEIIMPRKRLLRHKGCQMVHSRPRIYE